jgi:pSer/pThr/pTyr-binding forkhead associated (FHA) protein
MFKDNGERKDFPLTAQTTVIGRKEDCDIRIPLAEVSRQHAQFLLSTNKLSLRDLKSANGTFVNNHRVQEKDLSPGDRVVIGPVVFTVQIDGQPASIKPAKTKLQRKPQAPAPAAAPSKPTKSAKPAAQIEPDHDDIRALDADAAVGSAGKEKSSTDSLGESDLALEALSESGSMSFSLDDLEFGDDSESKDDSK